MGLESLNNAIADAGNVVVPVARSTGSPNSVSSRNIRDFQADLPALERQPKDVQELIHAVREIKNDSYAQMSLIHAKALERMQFRPELDEKNEDFSYKKVIEKGRVGDCDDHATYEAALLRYAGYDPKDMALLGGEMEYESENGKKINVNHAVLVVARDGKTYVLDKNQESPGEMGSNGQVAGRFAPDFDHTGFAPVGSAMNVNVLKDPYYMVPAASSDGKTGAWEYKSTSPAPAAAAAVPAPEAAAPAPERPAPAMPAPSGP